MKTRGELAVAIARDHVAIMHILYPRMSPAEIAGLPSDVDCSWADAELRIAELWKSLITSKLLVRKIVSHGPVQITSRP